MNEQTLQAWELASYVVTVVGLPYAIGNAAFGGTAEYVALAFKQAAMEEVFFYYVAAICTVAFLASLCMPDLRKHGYLDGDGKVEENIPPFRWR